MAKLNILSVVSIAIGLVIIGTIAYSALEDWGLVDSFYFSVTTLTTVGYGDMHPTTTASKLFTSFYALIGVGIMLYALTVLAGQFFNVRSQKILKAIKGIKSGK